MKATDVFFKKQETIRRSYDVSEKMYERLVFLSQNVYEASVNKLVCVSIQHLIKTENVTLFVSESTDFYSKRTFILPKELIIGLDQLSKKYNIGVSKLVNIAIYRLLEEETEYFEKTTF